MRSRSLLFCLALVVAVSLGGCAGVPVLGGLSEKVAGLVEPLRNVLQPILGGILPKPEAPASTPLVAHHLARRAAATVAGGPVATASVVDPSVVFAQWAARNREFDRLRTNGLICLYDGDTASAIEHFRRAQALRPEDEQIASLLNLALHPVPRKRSMDFGLGGSPPGAPVPQPPEEAGALLEQPGPRTGPAPGNGAQAGGGVPPGLTGVLKSLQRGGGDKPGQLF